MYEFVKPAEGVGYVKIPDAGGFSSVFVIGTPENAILIDTYMPATAADVIATLEANGYTNSFIHAIIITHGHIDHFGGAEQISAWCKAPVWAHHNTFAQMGNTVRVDRELQEGDRIEYQGFVFNVLHIPGHEQGEIALYEKNKGYVFTGDLVQGGMDGPKTWLGLYTDTFSQRKSLERIIALQSTWNFKGHRAPRRGQEVLTDLRCAVSRLDEIERSLCRAVSAGAGRTDADLARICIKDVLSLEITDAPSDFAMVSVRACLAGLAHAGRMKQNPDQTWSLLNGR